MKGVRVALRGLTTRGRSLLACGLVLVAAAVLLGQRDLLRAGLLLPRTRPPYGYRLDPERLRDPTGVTLAPDEAAVVAELFSLYLEPGASLAHLAQTLQWRAIPTPGIVT